MDVLDELRLLRSVERAARDFLTDSIINHRPSIPSAVRLELALRDLPEKGTD